MVAALLKAALICSLITLINSTSYPYPTPSPILAPTTKAPTTPVLTTKAPTKPPKITIAPTTKAPTKPPKITIAPTTKAPTKPPTTTLAPTTKAPPIKIPTKSPKCGPNQVFTETDNNPCRDTCDNPNLSQVCRFIPRDYPGCICVDGYVKDNDGSCIKRELCHIICTDPNSELVDRPNVCPGGGTCDNPKPSLCRLGRPRKGCQCKKGYVKDKDGKCILLSQCPTPICGPNQVYTATDNNPCRDTCDSPNLSQVCRFIPGDYPGCICVDGYVKDNDGSCIERKQCDIPCDDPNAEIVDWPTRCPDSGTCDNPEIRQCKALSPRKGCQCKENYLKNIDGKCVLPADCFVPPYSKRGALTTPAPTKCSTSEPPKPTCGKNEFYSPRAPVFPRACDNLKKVLCKSVKPGCACIPGYIRESSAKGAKCVKPCNCPPCKI